VRTGFAPETETLSGPQGHTLTAVVVAGDDETRVLLRALLRLHQVWVEGEARSENEAFELVRTHRPSLLIVDASLAEGSLYGLIGQSRALVPGLRVILVAPASHVPDLPSNPTERPDVVLLRPFLIHQFAEALRPPGADGSPGSR